MNRYRRIAVGLGMLLVASCGPATAAPAQLPIGIDADKGELSQQTNTSIYTGNVKLTRGGLTMNGARLVVTRINDRGNIKAVLTGSPARFVKLPDQDSDQRVTGHASSIEYTNNNSTVVLHGDAEVDRGGDQVTGQVITHDLDTQRTQAQSGSGAGQRVHITIQPQDKTSDSSGN